MSECKQTFVPEYAEKEDCEKVSTDCLIYESAISYLELEENSTVTEVINALLLSLMDARNEIRIINNKLDNQ